MSARFDEQGLAFPLRWLAATLLLLATGHALRKIDDRIAAQWEEA